MADFGEPQYEERDRALIQFIEKCIVVKNLLKSERLKKISKLRLADEESLYGEIKVINSFKEEIKLINTQYHFNTNPVFLSELYKEISLQDFVFLLKKNQ